MRVRLGRATLVSTRSCTVDSSVHHRRAGHGVYTTGPGPSMQVIVTLGKRELGEGAPAKQGLKSEGHTGKTHLLTPVSAPAVLDGPERNLGA